jgi:hypothetical protein
MLGIFMLTASMTVQHANGQTTKHTDRTARSDDWSCPLHLTTKLEDPHPSVGGNFGYDVALDGDYVIVSGAGIYERNHGGPDAWGLVYSIVDAPVDLKGDLAIAGEHVIERIDGTWTETGQLPYDNHESVSIDASGNRIAVGEPFAGGIQYGGEVRIYSRPDGAYTTWDHDHTLRAPNSEFGDTYGWSLAWDSFLVVGDPWSNLVADSAGAVYVYSILWPEPVHEATITAFDAQPYDWFGNRVALGYRNSSVVGWTPYAVISAHTDDDGPNSGAVYVYDIINGSWQFNKRITASLSGGAYRFGQDLDCYGSVIAAGSSSQEVYQNYGIGAVYLLDQDYCGTNAWGERQFILPEVLEEHQDFGWAVAIDGTTLVASAPFRDGEGVEDSGIVYILEPRSPDAGPTSLVNGRYHFASMHHEWQTGWVWEDRVSRTAGYFNADGNGTLFSVEEVSSFYPPDSGINEYELDSSFHFYADGGSMPGLVSGNGNVVCISNTDSCTGSRASLTFALKANASLTATDLAGVYNVAELNHDGPTGDWYREFETAIGMLAFNGIDQVTWTELFHSWGDLEDGLVPYSVTAEGRLDIPGITSHSVIAPDAGMIVVEFAGDEPGFMIGLRPDDQLSIADLIGHYNFLEFSHVAPTSHWEPEAHNTSGYAIFDGAGTATLYYEVDSRGVPQIQPDTISYGVQDGWMTTSSQWPMNPVSADGSMIIMADLEPGFSTDGSGDLGVIILMRTDDPIGACCIGDVSTCTILDENTCVAMGGTWAGIGTDCVDLNGNGTADECEGTLCPWDTTSLTGGGPNGEVDVGDFFALLQHWGPCPALPEVCPWDTTDLEGGPPNGQVDVGDFFALLQHWGPCP